MLADESERVNRGTAARDWVPECIMDVAVTRAAVGGRQVPGRAESLEVVERTGGAAALGHELAELLRLVRVNCHSRVSSVCLREVGLAVPHELGYAASSGLLHA